MILSLLIKEKMLFYLNLNLRFEQFDSTQSKPLFQVFSGMK